MPRGPKGEKRPADVIGNAVHVMQIATGEIEDSPRPATSSVCSRLHRLAVPAQPGTTWRNHRPQSSSASRLTAGAAGFLTFTQQSARPDR